MACENDPQLKNESQRQDAVCHMCQKVKSCGFCNLCCHWFCRDCNPKIFSRGIEAVKELLRGAKAGCCGVVQASQPQQDMVDRLCNDIVENTAMKNHPSFAITSFNNPLK